MTLLRSFRGFDRKSIVRLGLWGPPGSGKTTLLAMINSTCESYGWTIQPDMKETSDYIETVTGQLFERGKPNPPTVVGKPFLHRFILRKFEDWRQREFALEIPDAAGELYTHPEHPLFNMIDYLNGCDGIMWLLDPIALRTERLYGSEEYQRSYRQMIYRTLSRIFQTRYQSRGRIDKYMAFVLTKMDDPNHVQYFDDPKEYALTLLGKQVERTIESFCMLDRVEFFSTSALGFADKAHLLSNLDAQHQTLRTKTIEPIGIFDPLNWLLSRLT